MTRSRRSAKDAGTRFESLIAACLAQHVDFRIERRARNGAADRGDLSGIYLSPALGGHPVVAECKDTTRTDLAGWSKQAEVERGNADAAAGVTIAKRHGKGDPLDQWAFMTVRDLISLLTGERPEGDQ